MNTDSSEVIRNKELRAKRNKTEKEPTLADKTKEGIGKMIELDYVSSDEGFWSLSRTGPSFLGDKELSI